MAVTDDALFDGAVRFFQPARGYRANADTLWLADFAAKVGAARDVIDLGAGVGVVALALHHHAPFRRVVCVERDAALAELCSRNLARNAVPGESLSADVAKLPRALSASFDLAVCNPPFFEPGERRPAAATREHARAGELRPFIAAARFALGRRGRLVLIYPARSLARVFGHAREHGLEPKRLRLIHAFASEPARVALLELKGGKPGGLVIEPPAFEWSAPGVAGPELGALSAPRASDRTRSRRLRAR